jgi:hypothetical protein
MIASKSTTNAVLVHWLVSAVLLWFLNKPTSQAPEGFIAAGLGVIL